MNLEIAVQKPAVVTQRVFYFLKHLCENSIEITRGVHMKKIQILAVLAITALALCGCLSTSPVGVNCVQGTPFQDLPLACIGH